MRGAAVYAHLWSTQEVEALLADEGRLAAGPAGDVRLQGGGVGRRGPPTPGAPRRRGRPVAGRPAGRCGRDGVAVGRRPETAGRPVLRPAGAGLPRGTVDLGPGPAGRVRLG